MSDDESLFVVLLHDGDATLKLRVWGLASSHRPLVSGEEIASAILAHPNMTFDTNGVGVEVYDSRSEAFVLLDAQKDVATELGRRLQCSINRPAAQEPVLAIMGRYFPYDDGMMVANTRVEAREMPNIPGAGTGLNVWDGAVLL
jgi:hypothetical protein